MLVEDEEMPQCYPANTSVLQQEAWDDITRKFWTMWLRNQSNPRAGARCSKTVSK